MRNRHFLVLDTLGMLCIPFITLALRFEFADWPAGYLRTVIVFTALSLPIRLAVIHSFRLYEYLWRHASIVEMERIVAAGVVIGTLNLLVGTFGLRLSGLVDHRMPISALVLDAALTLGLLAGSRLAVRFRYSRPRQGSLGRRTIVVGAGSAGQLIARESLASTRASFQIVGFVDDNPRKLGQLLNGVRVEGLVDDLPRLIRTLAAEEVVIAVPSARGALVRRVVDLAAVAGARTRTVPSFSDLVSGHVEVTALRPVEIHDLLRRAPIKTDMDKVGTLGRDRVVLITGAGGSIGSELCRQIGALSPSLLVIVDHSENQIFEIDRELRRRFPELAMIPVIADVRDARRLSDVFGRYKPFAVFHAAAHKHVPLMEENVIEAVTNNVMGTRNVVEASVEHGVTHFVLISTDKAVRPTSVMGATKRLAEQIVRLAAAREHRHFVAVRFGNVLGSRGSVVPTFMQQIAAGGPITVTHPDMQRYFMTIPEAVQLVLQAGALGTGGEIFVLDMGEPVKIVDLARDLIRLSGLQESADIEIRYTGLRPGEKLFEEVLFGDEDVRETEHPKVIRALSEIPDAAVEGRIDELIRLAAIAPHDESRLRQMLIALVPDFILPADADAKILRLPADRRKSGEILLN